MVYCIYYIAEGFQLTPVHVSTTSPPLMTLTTKHYLAFLFILSNVLFFSRDTSSTEPVRIVTHVQATENNVVSVPQEGKYEYLEITQSCNPEFQGLCIPVYAGPGTHYEEVADLRTGMMLKIKETVKVNGVTWHHVYFDEWLRYPGRVTTDWYVPAVAGRVVRDNGLQELGKNTPSTNKRIVVDISDHTIYAYDGTVLFLQTKVAVGVDEAPTPVGTFTIFKKTPSRYMQGPLPGVNDNAFDLPGVPWNMYFTTGGAVIHGSYWHDRYGTEQSSGCINLPPEIAKILYDWSELGTTVTIQN
ncbi:MAG: L,D-transpeptidase [Candidatus Paceibacterota bacterium]